MKCNTCGAENPVDYQFCGDCRSPRQNVITAPSRPPILDHIVHNPPEFVSPPNGRHSAPSWVDPNRHNAQPRIENTGSDTTRYLCAAMYLKPGLASKIRSDIIDENHRALGPSGGVDTGAILRHALAAVTYQATRNFGLVVTLVLGLYGLWTFSFSLILIAFVAGWLILTIYLLSIKYGVLVGKLQRSRFRADDAPQPGNAELRYRLDALAQHVDGNVTIYGAYSPFVGDGAIFKNWSTVVDLSKVKDKNTTMPFNVAELHKAVSDDVRALELPGLRVVDRLFVGGDAIRGDRRFLDDPYERPKTTVDQSVIDDCAANPENSCRRYTHFQITGWHGEVVISTFLRLVLFRRSLFVEANYTALTPLPQECYEIDAIPPGLTIGSLFGTAGRAAAQLVPTTLGAIPEVARLCWRPIASLRHDASEVRLIRSDMGFDYGARTTIRESAASGTYRRFFQRMDREMNTKLIDKRIFDQIIAYLEDHNIDTGELQQVQATLVNTNIFGDNNGIVGSVHGDAVAVGEKSMARASRKLINQITKDS